ncbi:MAG: glycosyl hydrolase, partial [Cellvibrionaceae bacterium]|nr:glycosyl hydrolase [Cellvibrionaceae bacterium]
DGLSLRNIGPATTGGRIADIAVNPTNPAQYYLGVASGGVWKTDNAGITWQPLFDDQGSYSIGDVTLDPNQPNVVWVGTGENNSQRSVGYGDGVYKSVDGGKSWTNTGLTESEHIARIVIDPRNSNVVYVAAQGPLWRAGGDRGVYKSTDGGTTWTHSLAISEHTGVTDLLMDPRNPDVLYAASYQRRRHVWTLINGGPESTLYKSTDAGKSWQKIDNGLPSSDMGRIGLALAPSQPDTLYAIVEAQEGAGFYRSDDAGGSWHKQSDY